MTLRLSNLKSTAGTVTREIMAVRLIYTGTNQEMFTIVVVGYVALKVVEGAAAILSGGTLSWTLDRKSVV